MAYAAEAVAVAAAAHAAAVAAAHAVQAAAHPVRHLQPVSANMHRPRTNLNLVTE